MSIAGIPVNQFLCRCGTNCAWKETSRVEQRFSGRFESAFRNFINSLTSSQRQIAEVSSGVRCREHDLFRSGRHDYNNLNHLAVDLRRFGITDDDMSRDIVARICANAWRFGFTDFGIDNTYLHIDLGNTRKGSLLVWDYHYGSEVSNDMRQRMMAYIAQDGGVFKK